MSFHPDSIWFLALLALVPFAWWATTRRGNRATISYSRVASAEAAGRTFRSRLRWVPTAIRLVVLSLIIVSLARPVKANEHTKVTVEGIAMQMLVDRSSSMLAEDFELNGRSANRLQVVKRVGAEFIAGGNGLSGRPNDLIGLIAFAGFADNLSPMTLDHPHLLKALGGLEQAQHRSEDGTAIGDAVALAVEKLRAVGSEAKKTGRQRITSRVIVLLTDGENTMGDIEPLMAADLAAESDIKIYTIGVGTRGMARVPVRDPFGRQEMSRQRVSIDEDTLTEMADRTGGRYFRATDTDSLKRIYETIDKLEKTETEERRYLQYTDFAVEPMRLGNVEFPPLLLTAFCLLALEQLLAMTAFKTLA